MGGAGSHWKLASPEAGKIMLFNLKRLALGGAAIALIAAGAVWWFSGEDSPATPTWDLSGGHQVVHVAFSPDGARVATASFDKTVRVWDAATGASVATALGHADKIVHVAFSPDGRRLVSASHDKSARIWDANTGEAAAPALMHEDIVVHAAFSAAGDLVVSASRDKTAGVWDVSSGKALNPFRITHSSSVRHAAFSPDGTRLVTACEDKSIHVQDITRLEALAATVSNGVAINYVAFSPNGKQAVAVDTSGYSARSWDVPSGKPRLSATRPLIKWPPSGELKK